MKLKVALIGLGYWGNNIARNLILHPDYELIAIVDTDRHVISKSHLNLDCEFYESTQMLPDKLDVVFVATRPNSHFELVRELASKTQYIVLAKPACSSLSEAHQLLTTYIRNSHPSIFVDYTYHYSSLINKFKSYYLKDFNTSEALEITSYRTALGIIQSDVSVIADLLSHDLSIFLKLLPCKSLKVQCINSSSKKKGKETSIMANLQWNNGHVLSCHVSWMSPQKIRRISLVTRNKALVVNEMSNSNSLEVINFNEVTKFNSLEDKVLRNQKFSLGDTFSLDVPIGESLYLELTELSKAYKSGATHGLFTLSDAVAIWKVINALEKSLNQNGIIMEVTL